MSEEALRTIALQVRNWGKWGPDDELGTLNNTPPERIGAPPRPHPPPERYAPPLQPDPHHVPRRRRRAEDGRGGPRRRGLRRLRRLERGSPAVRDAGGVRRAP